MNSIREMTIEPRLWPRAFLSALRGATLVAMLTLITAAPAHADVWYSGAAVAPNGAVLGWGVTDVTNYSMFHMAWATTTLTSPVKHRQASSTASAQNWTRTDVSLAFDPDDLGTYSVSTFHEGYCYWIYAFILAATSLAPVNDAPARLVHANYPPCAPGGVGPLQIITNGNVVDCSGTVRETGFCGVNRNLMYQLLDGSGTPFVGAYTIRESFSNYQTTNNNLRQPDAHTINVPAYGLLGVTCPPKTGPVAM